MSGFFTGLLNISLMIVLGLTVLIERGQRHAAVAQYSPEQILSAPAPAQLDFPQRLNDSAARLERTEGVPALTLPDIQEDFTQLGAFIESWMKRLSLQLYSAVVQEQPIEGQRLWAEGTEWAVRPAVKNKIQIDPNLMVPLVIPPDKEPIAVSAL